MKVVRINFGRKEKRNADHSGHMYPGARELPPFLLELSYAVYDNSGPVAHGLYDWGNKIATGLPVDSIGGRSEKIYFHYTMSGGQGSETAAVSIKLTDSAGYEKQELVKMKTGQWTWVAASAQVRSIACTVAIRGQEISQSIFVEEKWSVI